MLHTDIHDTVKSINLCRFPPCVTSIRIYEGGVIASVLSKSEMWVKRPLQKEVCANINAKGQTVWWKCNWKKKAETKKIKENCDMYGIDYSDMCDVRPNKRTVLPSRTTVVPCIIAIPFTLIRLRAACNVDPQCGAFQEKTRTMDYR